ncbi:hypothetical protein [Streptomyces sp. H27-C3]|uniref:hypothetical protein n=1 Tax=Streptomyces sp. H27-C3 TaxID=3046305 RepID=UPI0024BBD92B|nr:hypothetical protein [Streptomyces sp. H27-C3]MDJ0465067.1 hypothetical protein [Streptomyces sp. H27-C3]
MSTQTPTRTRITPRPAGEDFARIDPGDFARAREVRADQVALGDTVVAAFPGSHEPGTGPVDAVHFTDPYWAMPGDVDPLCGCLCCQADAYARSDGPLVLITEGFPWDGCDIHPAAALLLVIPYRCDCGCDTTPPADWTGYDWDSAPSLQHLRETGRPLRPGEALDLDLTPAAR